MTKKLIGLLALLACVVSAGAQSPVTPNVPRVSSGNVAGLLYASNFGQWQVPKGNLGPYSWNSSSYCYANTVGVTFPAFTVGTPLLLVDEVNSAVSEFVTPTIVTAIPAGPGTTGSCAITVAPVNPHTYFHFTSGTYGLQEAINWAGTNVYTVVLTPDWALLGGTTGMITAATGNTSVSILDQRTAGAFVYTWNGSAYVQSGGNTPGGSTGQVQYNNAGTFAANANLTTNGAGNLTAAGTVAASYLSGVITPTSNLAAQTSLNNLDKAGGATPILMTPIVADACNYGTTLVGVLVGGSCVAYPQTLTVGSSTSSTITFTMASVPSQFVAGVNLIAQGNAPAGFNGYFQVASVTATTVTVSSTANPGTLATFGTLSLAPTDNLSTCNTFGSIGGWWQIPPTVGTNGGVYLSGTCQITTNSVHISGGGWGFTNGTTNPGSTVIYQNCTACSAFNLALPGSPNSAQSYDWISNMNIINVNASNGSTAPAIYEPTNPGTGYTAEGTMIDHVGIQNYAQAIVINGTAKGRLDNIFAYASNLSATSCSGGSCWLYELGGPSVGAGIESWHIVQLAGSCAPVGDSSPTAAGALWVTGSGGGNYAELGDLDSCVPFRIGGGTAANGNSWVIKLENNEGNPGPSIIDAYSTVTVINSSGLYGGGSNTVGPAFLMQGNGSFKLDSTNYNLWIPSVATNAPVTSPLTTATTGGSMPASTTYYVTTQCGNIFGTTIQSNEVSITTGAGATNTVTAAWTYPSTMGNACTTLNVCMSTTPGTEALVTTINNPTASGTLNYTITSGTVGSTCSSTSTFRYPVIAALAGDTAILMGPPPNAQVVNTCTGSASSAGMLISDKNGEYFNGYLRIPNTDGVTPIANACWRGTTFYTPGKESSTGDESLAYGGRNAAGSYTFGPNLINFWPETVTDSTNTTQLLITESGAGGSVPVAQFKTTATTGTAVPLSVSSATANTGAGVFTMIDGASASSYGFYNNAENFFHNLSLSTTTAATNGTNQNSPSVTLQGNAYSTTATSSEPCGYSLKASSNNTAQTPTITMLLGVSCNGNLSPTYLADFTAAAGGLKVASLTDTALSSGNCVQSGAGGLLANAAGPCIAPVNTAISSATGGTGTGTVTCLTATCTNVSGTYSVAGGTFTTGNLLVLVWPTTTTAYKCRAVQNGGVATYGIGHSVATATGMTITAGISVAAITVTIDYDCSQF